MWRFESVLEDIDSAFILKEEQRNALKAFVDRKDIFAVLPTESGKSLIYQLAPMAFVMVIVWKIFTFPASLTDSQPRPFPSLFISPFCFTQLQLALITCHQPYKLHLCSQPLPFTQRHKEPECCCMC